MKSSLRLIISIFILSVSFPEFSVAQESILKKFAKTRSDKQYTLYASTLRMLNISKDPNFYDFVNDIEKINVIFFDSTTTADKSYSILMSQYSDESFDEYMTMYGSNFAFVAGKEEDRNMDIIGVFGREGLAFAVYIKGAIPFQKIPQLIDVIRNNDILKLLELDNSRN